MLVLRRKAGEAIVLNGTITIHVLAVEGERVKLGINAPPEVVIVRSELLEGGQSSGSGAISGGPVPAPREPRPYTYRDPGQRPYREPREPRDPDEENASEELPDARRTSPGSVYSGPPRYSPRRRMYDDPPTSPAPFPNPNPRYR
ncbi:MAG: carbon storage regulator [Nitrososphaerota archaeon]